jgi:hypothetical protein
MAVCLFCHFFINMQRFFGIMFAPILLVLMLNQMTMALDLYHLYSVTAVYFLVLVA